MAYDDPYFGTATEVDAPITTGDYPPEAPDAKSNIEATIALVAGGILLAGVIIGWIIAHLGSGDE